MTDFEKFLKKKRFMLWRLKRLVAKKKVMGKHECFFPLPVISNIELNAFVNDYHIMINKMPGYETIKNPAGYECSGVLLSWGKE